MKTPPPGQRAWRALLGLLAAVVGVLALMPAPPDATRLGWDKLNHLAAFAALALCAVFGWRDARAARLAWLPALLAYGAAIELLQRQVPNRSAEWSDLLADAIGIAAGALLAEWWLRRHGRPSAPGRGAAQSSPAAPPRKDRA
jgi:VanZ family protein